jgi:hypothetical protein
MMLRLQRQKDRNKRRNFKYRSIPQQRPFRYYHLNLDEYDYPQKDEDTSFKVQTIPKQKQFHHRHLNLNEYENIPEVEFTNYRTKETPELRKFHHRFIKLNDYDYPEKYDFRKYKLRNNNRFLSPMENYLRIPKKKYRIPYIHQAPIERQIGILAANPAGLGMAWFAGLVGLAAMTRAPISTLLEGVNPWTFLNGND